MVLGILLTLGIKAFFYFVSGFNDFTRHLFYLLYYAAFTNFGLFIFNMLPIPPLDGSHIVFSGLNIKLETEERIRKIGMPVLFIILLIQNFADITIIPIGKIIIAIISFIL
jgi:membrane-associated protease RseP (regulator of RpoE activity)